MYRSATTQVSALSLSPRALRVAWPGSPWYSGCTQGGMVGRVYTHHVYPGCIVGYIHQGILHPGRHSWVYTPGYTPPREAGWAIYTIIHTPQGGRLGYIHCYTHPREACWAIYHCYTHPRETCWLYTPLLYTPREACWPMYTPVIHTQGGMLAMVHTVTQGGIYTP